VAIAPQNPSLLGRRIFTKEMERGRWREREIKKYSFFLLPSSFFLLPSSFFLP